MLFIKSKPEEIAYHINQVETLLLSKEELEKIKRVTFLNEFIENDYLSIMLKEDIPDSIWVNETKKIVDLYKNKVKRNESLKIHIKECKNFIVYRYLEDKCSASKIEAFLQIGSWVFNEVDLKKTEKSRWVSQKFLRNFEFSDIPEKFKTVMKDNCMEIDLKWLHQNREFFFSNVIFKDLKKII